MKILILGLGKSGSTAFTYGIQSQLPNHKIVFEPADLRKINYNNKQLIVKYLNLKEVQKNKDLFYNFNKKILLIRHPYDRLISCLLYAPTQGKRFTNDIMTTKYVELLKRKTREPDSVSVVEIINTLNSITGSEMLQVFQEQYEQLLNLYKQANIYDFHIVKYEDFVDKKTQEIENYLGISFPSQIKVESKYKRVERSKKHSEWKNWFTKDDIEKLSQLFSEFNECLEYEENINFNAKKIINPEHSYLYVIKIINEYRRAKKLPEYEDGKINIGAEGFAIEQAMFRIKEKKFIEAEKIIQSAIEHNPKIAGAHLIHGNILIQQNKFNEAVIAILRALELEPDLSDAYVQLEKVLNKKKKAIT